MYRSPLEVLEKSFNKSSNLRTLRCIMDYWNFIVLNKMKESIFNTRNGSSNVNNEGTMMPSMFTVVSWLPVPLV